MSSNRQCDILFLSAHLDDTVLSCSLRLLQESKAGRRIKVATLFSAARPKLFGTDFYCARRAEDKAALSLLGVSDLIWLGFPDAVFRGPGYWSFSKIMTGEHLADRQFFDKVTTKVCSLYDELAPGAICLPLAVGTHIDHRCTFAMWNKLPVQAEIWFYEDRPHSFVPNSVHLRLQDINAEAIGIQAGSMDKEDAITNLVHGLSTVTMYKNVLKDQSQRLQYARYLARSIGEAQQRGTEKPLMKLKAELLGTTSLGELEQIVKAIAAYVSQTGMLYDNMREFRRESDSYTRVLDPSAVYAERYWRLER